MAFFISRIADFEQYSKATRNNSCASISVQTIALMADGDFGSKRYDPLSFGIRLESDAKFSIKQLTSAGSNFTRMLIDDPFSSDPIGTGVGPAPRS